jgi:hypothetical protein
LLAQNCSYKCRKTTTTTKAAANRISSSSSSSSRLKLLSIPPHKRDRELWTWICPAGTRRLVFLPFPALPSSYLGTEEKKRVRLGSGKEMWRRRQTTTKRTMMMIMMTMMMAVGVRIRSRRRRRVASTSVRNCYDPAATLVSAIFFSTATATAAPPAVIAP